MRKKPTIYIIIVCVWIVCAGLLIGSCAHIADFLFSTEGINAKSVLMALLLMSNSLMLSYMWLGSVKDFMFSFVFFLRRKKILGRYESIISIEPDESLPKPKFLLLYCTCNDFNEKALEACMRQDYENFETIILDDSSKSEYLKRIDDFAERPGVTVARRSDRAGFKAGNLNHYLQGRTDYDYFVVLDSDEVIPENYIKEVLKYYAYSPEVGVVQAAHQASEGENAFQSLMGLSVRSNGQICQVMKNFYGSNALIGHGMTISRACYEATHGFPAVVAEDISFAVDVKNSGYRVLYAPNILCTEEFPVNYICLKKRQAKWVQGNVEFMKKYGKSIAYSKMTWYEKLDVKLSHYNLPIIPMLSFFIILNAIFMGFLGFNIAVYSGFIIGLMALFLISPLIPDIFVHGRSGNILRLMGYCVLNFVVYASLVPMMIKTVFLAVCGKKAKFIVTPEESKKITLKETFLYSYDSILFAVAIGLLTYFTYYSLFPTLLIVSCCTLTPMAILIANIKFKKRAVCERKRATT